MATYLNESMFHKLLGAMRAAVLPGRTLFAMTQMSCNAASLSMAWTVVCSTVSRTIARSDTLCKSRVLSKFCAEQMF
jgi:hypothetical protein